ncbi:MAG: hypothetical protein VX589_20720 [Myxococcota bacterium]|nr:hypothetical protein [Myxococcota bacterium]
MRRWVMWSLIWIFLSGSAVAWADEKSAPHTRLSEVLGELRWGQGTDTVLGQVEKELEAEWKDKLRVLDTIGIDRLKAQTRARFARIKKSLVHFNKATTGFESSVLGPEILSGRNESMLKLGTGHNEKYYFFRDNQLWKIVVVRDATRAGDFSAILNRLKGAFGKPQNFVFGTVNGKKTMTAARWHDQQTTVTVSDQRLFYNAYVIRFLRTGAGETFQAERANRPAPTAVQASSDPALNELFAGDESGDGAQDDDVVDRLTGQEHALDLESGRPKYQPIVPTAPGRPVPNDNPEGKSKKKTKNKVESAPKKRTKTSEKSGIVF